MNITVLKQEIRQYSDATLKRNAINTTGYLMEEIKKDLSGSRSMEDIIEKTADTLIALKQLTLIYGIQEQVDDLIDDKTDRLERSYGCCD